MIKYLLSALLFCSLHIFSQTIPSSRITDWSNAGYSDSFPQPITVLDVTDFGAVGDSSTDNTFFVQNAIDSLHGSRGVIFFPAGKFLMSLPVTVPDSAIIRGQSADSTFLIFNFNGSTGNCFNINGSIPGTFTNVTSGAVRGSNYILVNDPQFFTAGSYAELLEYNGSWDTQPVSWADNSVGQMLNILSISGDTLFFDSPLRISYDSILVPRVRLIAPAKQAGIECIHILRTDTASGTNYNIFFNYAANCWVRGVESSISIGSHIEIDASTHITVTGNYIHHSYVYDGVSTHGYGITLFNHSGECLITNNIMKHLRHSFSLQTGANGNVISYNYSLDPNRSETPSNAGADISLHGHYPYMNLFEGNIVQNIQIDQTHGPNGPFNTFFRNRAELYGLIMSSGTVQSDSQNFAGNEIPNTQILMGNYILTGGGHFEYANNVRGTITPAGATSLSDSSYYLSTTPSFWQSGLFPSIGMPNALSSGTIPAYDRYISGINLASCDENIPVDVNEIQSSLAKIFPIPSNGLIHVELTGQEKTIIKLKDLNGRIIFKQIINSSSTLNVNHVLPGMYLLEINSGQNIQIQKIVLAH